MAKLECNAGQKENYTKAMRLIHAWVTSIQNLELVTVELPQSVHVEFVEQALKSEETQSSLEALLSESPSSFASLLRLEFIAHNKFKRPSAFELAWRDHAFSQGQADYLEESEMTVECMIKKMNVAMLIGRRMKTQTVSICHHRQCVFAFLSALVLAASL